MSHVLNPCLYELLASRARESPDRPAILAPDQEPLTYSRLLARVEAIVSALNDLGLGRNDRVAVVLPNGPEMAVTFLAVASGMTCAPLNPAYQAAEHDFYLSDLGAKAVIVPPNSQQGLTPPKDGAELVCLDSDCEVISRQSPERPNAAVSPENLAYIIFTSGSTGRAKGVQICHRSATNLVDFVRQEIGLAERIEKEDEDAARLAQLVIGIEGLSEDEARSLLEADHA